MSDMMSSPPELPDHTQLTIYMRLSHVEAHLLQFFVLMCATQLDPKAISLMQSV